MYDETVRDSCKDGKKFTELLRSRGIHCGIKVDTGLVPIGGTNDETATQGLDGLGKRCAEYYEMGCRFAKWRAVVKIGDGLPSEVAIAETAHSLARYGSICQQNGLVPIIEPEILQDGSHDI
jgi:fructose-bisphosphate aldolase class I